MESCFFLSSQPVSPPHPCFVRKTLKSGLSASPTSAVWPLRNSHAHRVFDVPKDPFARRSPSSLGTQTCANLRSNIPSYQLVPPPHIIVLIGFIPDAWLHSPFLQLLVYPPTVGFGNPSFPPKKEDFALYYRARVPVKWGVPRMDTHPVHLFPDGRSLFPPHPSSGSLRMNIPPHH